MPDKDGSLPAVHRHQAFKLHRKINSNRLDCCLCCFMQTGFGHLTCLCFFLKKLRILFGIVHLLYLCCLIKDKLFFFFVHAKISDTKNRKRKKKTVRIHPLMCLFHPILPFGRYCCTDTITSKICVSMQKRAFAIFLKNFRFLI